MEARLAWLASALYPPVGAGGGDEPLIIEPWDPVMRFWVGAGLLTGTGITALMGVVYFLFENAPWHKTQAGEHLYIHLSLSFTFWPTVIISILHGLWYNVEVIQLRAVQLSLLLQFLSTNSMQPKVLPKFFDHTWSARQAAKSRIDNPLPLFARRFAMELDQGAALVLSLCNESSPFTLHPTLLVGTLFMLHVLDAFSKVYTELLTWRTWSTVANSLALCVSILGHIHWIWRTRQCRVLQAALGALIMDLANNANMKTIELVLGTVNMPTLLEVSPRGAIKDLVYNTMSTNKLTTLSKAILVDGLQQTGSLYNSRTFQRFARDLIISCVGEELTLFKNLLDGGGSYHNFYKLVYKDLSKGLFRDEILRHIAAEAMRGGQGHKGIKVVSDLDDTLFCSGGVFPAGCDKRLPKHTCYPGCLSFFQALDSSWDAQSPMSNLVFLSARPHIYKSVAEERSYARFRDLVIQGRMHVCPTLLPGSVPSGLWATVTYFFLRSVAWRPVAETKCRTFQHFMALYPEYDFVFFGDSGQGDLLMGQMLLEHQAAATAPNQLLLANSGAQPRLLAALIHEVKSEEFVLAQEDADSRGHDWRDRLRRSGLFLHKSYLGAALALHAAQPELLPLERLADIAKGAVYDMDHLRLSYIDWPWRNEEQRLQRELRNVDALLRPAGKTAPELRPIGDLYSAEGPHTVPVSLLSVPLGTYNVRSVLGSLIDDE